MEFRHFQTYRLPRGRRSDPPLGQAAAPAATVSRRLRPVLRRSRGRWLDLDELAGQSAPLVIASRRARLAPLLRRGRFVSFVPDQVVVAPGFWVPEIRHRTIRVLFVRRGRFVDPPWPQQAPPVAPPIVFDARRARVRLGVPRRGRILPMHTAVHAHAPASPKRPRIASPFARRGRAWTPVPAQVTVTAPTFVPPVTAARRLRGLLQRRGRLLSFVPAQVVAAPPPYPPQWVFTRRLRGVRIARGRRFDAIPPDSARRVPDRPLRVRVRWVGPRKRGLVRHYVYPGATYGPVPPWLEGQSRATGGDGFAAGVIFDGDSSSSGGDATISGTIFDGDPSARGE